MEKGISFSLGGSKRSASGRPRAAPPAAGGVVKKPGPVVDIFAEESDEEGRGVEEVPQEESCKKARRELSVAAAVCPPDDPTIRHVAERLAEFVAKNGRNYEEITRQRNPGETPFKFLFHRSSHEYLYYEAKLKEFQANPGATRVIPQDPQPPPPPPPPPPPLPPPPPFHVPSQQPPPPLPQQEPSMSTEERPKPKSRFSKHPVEDPKTIAKQALAAGDSIAAMNAYMKLAAKQEESRPKQGASKAPQKLPEVPVAIPVPPVPEESDSPTPRKPELLNDTAFERRRTYAVYKDDGSRGHHMQDFIPADELAKFMAKCQDNASQSHAKALEDQAKIGSDNIGHKLLSRMGWKEGEGLGAQGKGIAKPVEAGSVKSDNLGLGAISVGDVTSEDDVYEQYRKRMMLGYKFRPNPLGNPRRAYY